MGGLPVLCVVCLIGLQATAAGGPAAIGEPPTHISLTTRT